MARMFAKCLIFLTILFWMVAPISTTMKTIAPLQAVSIANPMASIDGSATDRFHAAGFQWEVDARLHSALSGRVDSQVGLTGCRLTSAATADHVVSTDRNTVSSGSTNCPAEKPPALSDRAFTKTICGLLKQTVLNVDVMSSFCPVARSFFVGVYRNAAYHSLNVSRSILPGFSSRDFSVIGDEQNFAGSELFINTDDEISGGVEVKEAELNPLFAEFPDEYWSYYEDCDRWDVEFDTTFVEQIVVDKTEDRASEAIAKSNENSTKAGSDISEVAKNTGPVNKPQSDKGPAVIAARLVEQATSSFVAAIGELEFAITEAPEIARMFPMTPDPAAKYVLSENPDVVTKPLSQIKNADAGMPSFEFVSAFVRSVKEMGRQIDLNQYQERLVYHLALAVEMEKERHELEKLQQAQLNRYLAPRLKWISDGLDDFASRIDEGSNSRFAGRGRDGQADSPNMK